MCPSWCCLWTIPAGSAAFVSDTRSSLRCSKDSSAGRTRPLDGLAHGGSLGAEPPRRTMAEAKSVQFRNPGKQGPGPRGIEEKALSGGHSCLEAWEKTMKCYFMTQMEPEHLLWDTGSFLKLLPASGHSLQRLATLRRMSNFLGLTRPAFPVCLSPSLHLPLQTLLMFTSREHTPQRRTLHVELHVFYSCPLRRSQPRCPSQDTLPESLRLESVLLLWVPWSPG